MALKKPSYSFLLCFLLCLIVGYKHNGHTAELLSLCGFSQTCISGLALMTGSIASHAGQVKETLINMVEMEKHKGIHMWHIFKEVNTYCQQSIYYLTLCFTADQLP